MTLSGVYEPSPNEYVRNQVEKYERSGGTEGTTMRGLPVVVLTSIGARTGRVRKTPLMRVEHDGIYAVVASQGGAPNHPVWYYNLKTFPEVELRDGTTVTEMIAREVTGEEKAQWWQRCVEAFPDYAGYQAKTDRQIPVLVLEPPLS